MALSSYDITITSAANVTATATMCSGPTYTVTAVRITAQPVFTDFASINDTQYPAGSNLISATGGTVVTSSPYVVTGATTAAIAKTTITGTYSTVTNIATFVIPFGTSFSSSTPEYSVGGSPREYDYSAYFVKTSGGVTSVADMIIAGKVRMQIGTEPRVPSGGSSTYLACSVTQV
jgi:hypothetical protein